MHRVPGKIPGFMKHSWVDSTGSFSKTKISVDSTHEVVHLGVLGVMKRVENMTSTFFPLG